MKRGPILIVDDDHGVRELVACALGDAYEVKQAATGGEALTILRREPVAVVVLDYRLPDGTGLEVLKDIRSVQPCVPVIMVTGHGSEWVCASAFKLGVQDYFRKPVDILQLVRSVRGALPRPLRESHAHHGAEERGDAPRTPLAVPAGRPSMPIQKAIQLIQEHYWDSLPLAWLAREVGMSKYRLSHCFSEVMGLPFREYLLTVRLERAKELLATGHASITEVAQAVGFSDLPRFDKLFKRHTGLTPSAYRSSTHARRNN